MLNAKDSTCYTLKYFLMALAVKVSPALINFSGVPSNIMLPPFMPAKGPISINQSA